METSLFIGYMTAIIPYIDYVDGLCYIYCLGYNIFILIVFIILTVLIKLLILTLLTHIACTEMALVYSKGIPPVKQNSSKELECYIRALSFASKDLHKYILYDRTLLYCDYYYLNHRIK